MKSKLTLTSLLAIIVCNYTFAELHILAINNTVGSITVSAAPHTKGLLRFDGSEPVHSAIPLPEPALLSLFAAGLLAMIGFGWIRRKSDIDSAGHPH